MKNNSQSRRMLNRAPAVAQEVIALLEDSQLLQRSTGSMAWHFDLAHQGSTFTVQYDRGQFDVHGSDSPDQSLAAVEEEDAAGIAAAIRPGVARAAG